MEGGGSTCKVFPVPLMDPEVQEQFRLQAVSVAIWPNLSTLVPEYDEVYRTIRCAFLHERVNKAHLAAPREIPFQEVYPYSANYAYDPSGVLYFSAMETMPCGLMGARYEECLRVVLRYVDAMRTRLTLLGIHPPSVQVRVSVAGEKVYENEWP